MCVYSVVIARLNLKLSKARTYNDYINSQKKCCQHILKFDRYYIKSHKLTIEKNNVYMKKVRYFVIVLDVAGSVL